MKRDLLIVLMLAALIFCLAFTSSRSGKKPKSFLEYLRTDTINYNAISTGEYQGECLSISIKNMVDDSIHFTLLPGTQFISDDPSFQDILIVKEEKISIGPKDNFTLNGFGFACDIQKKKPLKSAFFSTAKKAKPRLTKLARFIAKNNLPNNVIQSALWSVSNGNPVASITHTNKDSSMMVREFVAKLLGQEAPFYTITYIDDSSLFSGKPLRLFGEFQYRTFNLSIVDIRLVNKDGELIKSYKRGIPHQASTYLFTFDEDVSEWQRGTYYIKIYFDNALRYSKTIEI